MKSLLYALLRAERCVLCGREGCTAWLWATEGSGLHPVHAECLAQEDPSS